VCKLAQDPSPAQQQNFQNINATMINLSGNVAVAASGTANTTTTANLNVAFYVFQASGKINYGTSVPLLLFHLVNALF
jgi:hypothetical protein